MFTPNFWTRPSIIYTVAEFRFVVKGKFGRHWTLCKDSFSVRLINLVICEDVLLVLINNFSLKLDTLLASGVDLKSYTDTAYHNEELKSLSRYRFDKVKERAKLKQSVSRLVNILFPELEKLVPTLHIASVYALLSEFPGAHHIADAHLTRLKNLLHSASRGRYGDDTAVLFREEARRSIGSKMPAKSLELQHTIKHIAYLDVAIDEIESRIKCHGRDELTYLNYTWHRLSYGCYDTC